MQKKENTDITETKTVNYEEMAAQAELEAESDEVASVGREVLDNEEDATDGEDENRFRVDFFKEYEFDNDVEKQKIKSIDLSGLLDLTTVDGEKFDRILVKLGYRPPNKFVDITYCKHVAMHVTNLPAEFFNMLSMRDMLQVVGAVHGYFLFG